MWMQSPRHAGSKGNELADRLASRAPTQSNLQMDKEDLIKASLSKQNTYFEGSFSLPVAV